jgi:hypothetical protein
VLFAAPNSAACASRNVEIQWFMLWLILRLA